MGFSPQRVADGVYKSGDNFYYRPRKANGNRTWRALEGDTLALAKRDYLSRITSRQLPSDMTFAEAIEEYRQAGCPDRHREPRKGLDLSTELGRLKSLEAFFGKTPCTKLTLARLDDYADWRIKNRKKPKTHGGRAVDLDIVTLRHVTKWASRKGLLPQDPFEFITTATYRKRQISHCRDRAPKSGEELHAIATILFSHPWHRSDSIGWIVLITAMTGGRIGEMTEFRLDAKEGEPGFLSKEDGVIYVRRKKQGTNNFFRAHADLKECLEYFKKWRAGEWITNPERRKKFLASPWWFPGRDFSEPVSGQSVTRALHSLIEGEPRSAHGLRSFYVTCRRSAGLSDAEIALETGQVSGGGMIVKVYGDASPKKVTWKLKSGDPAWRYNFYTSDAQKVALLKKTKKALSTSKNGGQIENLDTACEA